jgi:hypothetical protein
MVGATLFCVATAPLTTAQIYVDGPSLPPSLDKAVAETPLIIRGRLVSERNDTYQMPAIGGKPALIPVSVYTVELLETLKAPGPAGAAPLVEVRHVGWSGNEQSPPSVRQRMDRSFPPLDIGGEYVLFLLVNQVGDWGFGYGAQGAFEERDGKVECAVRSEVAAIWRGKPWNQFITAIRELARRPVRSKRR